MFVTSLFKCCLAPVLMSWLEASHFLFWNSCLSPHYQPPSLLDCHSLGHYSPALTTPGPDTRQPGIAPMPQSPLKLFTLAGPKLAYLALPILSHKNHNKDLPAVPPCPSASSQTLVIPWVALGGVRCTPFFGNLE